MPHGTSNRLVEYAREHIGNALRTVAVIYENDCEVIYLREDLQTAYDPEQYKSVAESFRTDLGLAAHVTGESPVGGKQAIIHQHDSAFVFQFPHEDCHSILMSVDPEVGSQLRSFASECQQQI